MRRHWWRALRHRLYEILEHGPVGDRTGRVVGRLIVLLIVTNLVAITLQTVPEFETRYTAWFLGIELLSLLVFTFEYGLRMWVAVEHAPYLHSDGWKARLKYATSPVGIIDLFAVLPFWLAFVLPAELKILLVFRIIRFLKLARYSPGMRSLLDVLYAERRALFGCLVILIGATLVAATAMHIVERHVQPEKFGTIPDAMWWAIVTLGTIGYGDVVPVTPLGRIVAALVMISGLGVFGLWTGILATGFAAETRRDNFLKTWESVSKVPFFAALGPAAIADVTNMLRTMDLPPRTMIIRKGQQGDCMYFIAAGEVEVDLPGGKKVQLGEGAFFGEMALLGNATRNANITTTRVSQLLVLDLVDFRLLMARHPELGQTIDAEAKRRALENK